MTGNKDRKYQIRKLRKDRGKTRKQESRILTFTPPPNRCVPHRNNNIRGGGVGALDASRDMETGEDRRPPGRRPFQNPRQSGELGWPWRIRGLGRPWRSGELGRPWRIGELGRHGGTASETAAPAPTSVSSAGALLPPPKKCPCRKYGLHRALGGRMGSTDSWGRSTDTWGRSGSVDTWGRSGSAHTWGRSRGAGTGGHLRGAGTGGRSGSADPCGRLGSTDSWGRSVSIGIGGTGPGEAGTGGTGPGEAGTGGTGPGEAGTGGTGPGEAGTGECWWGVGPGGLLSRSGHWRALSRSGHRSPWHPLVHN